MSDMLKLVGKVSTTSRSRVDPFGIVLIIGKRPTRYREVVLTSSHKLKHIGHMNNRSFAAFFRLPMLDSTSIMTWPAPITLLPVCGLFVEIISFILFERPARRLRR
jgi:hypothetical protein